ncbi:hypothetical protein CDAR_264571 [Caerostris darwini]|uniref:Uncharacterized protein n=1 Tax=Caerostris darwini TaxID=1538125 RepID=A0AAV4NN37_9ARAC|nr:hypothetical protein CDAR_264571 [Caerostris darwini]
MAFDGNLEFQRVHPVSWIRLFRPVSPGNSRRFVIVRNLGLEDSGMGHKKGNSRRFVIVRNLGLEESGMGHKKGWIFLSDLFLLPPLRIKDAVLICLRHTIRL